MNTTSPYKKLVNKPDAKMPKVLSVNKTTKETKLPTHIKINTPGPIKNDCNTYTYDITKTLNTDLKQLPAKPKIIAFCIFRIITCKNREKPLYPFLQYLLYKYPSENKSIGDVLVFPFVKYKKGSITQIAQNTTKNITGEALHIKGFVEYNDEVYLFFDLHENKDIITENINLKKRNDHLWWCLLDEICNQNKVLNFPVHPSVYKTFYSNPALIYLKNEHNKRIDIPIVGYYGNYYKFIPMIAALGSQNSIRGQLNNSNLFYFSSFRKAIRYGMWSPFYRERIAYNKKITDIDGRYNMGGIVRFAIFLGKVDIPIDYSYDKISKLLQRNLNMKDDIDSLLVGSVNYDDVKININPEYILKHNNQYLSLSYHEIDNSTVGHFWDPDYKYYNIV